METNVLKEEVEPSPLSCNNLSFFYNEGLLSSSYKEETKNNFFNSNPKSIFGIKQRIKSKQYQFTSSGVGAILKLSIFVLAFVALS